MRKLILAAALCTALPVGVALAQTVAAPKAGPAKPAAQDTGGVNRTKPQAKATVAATPSPSYLPIKDFMLHVVNPAAEAYWAQSGSDDDDNRAPKDDAHWTQEYDHAAAIQEAGNLLLAQGRLINDPVWITNANKLIKGGQDGIKASIAHDADAGFDAGSTMYDACYDCHAKYVVRPKDSLYDHQIEIPKPEGDTHSLR